jgi:hypothetical protein
MANATVKVQLDPNGNFAGSLSNLKGVMGREPELY